MREWTLHWLNASGSLAEWRETILAEFEAAYDGVARIVTPRPLDILVQRLAGRVIPEIGILGTAYRGTLFSLTLDHDNPNFAPSLAGGTVRRQIVHEVHHCLRMAGPAGYGRTLGEALVSEGLAGRFTARILASAPEPWERAVAPERLAALAPSAEELAAPSYDHPAWFFGSGRHPRWLGYTLGYAMAGAWLRRHGEPGPEDWIGVSAETVIRSWNEGRNAAV